MVLRFLLVLIVVGQSRFAAAQTQAFQERFAIAYRTEVTTEQRKVLGVLEQVTDSNVIVRNDKNGYDYIPVASIKGIRIKFTPKTATYTVQDFFDVEDLQKTSEGFIDLNNPQNQQYLETNPLEMVVGNVFFNAVGILGTKGLNKLRKGMAATITKFRINGKPDKYARIKPNIQLYALQYQLSPEYEQYLKDALRTPLTD